MELKSDMGHPASQRSAGSEAAGRRAQAVEWKEGQEGETMRRFEFAHVAEGIAREAGALLREVYAKGVEAEYKGDVDLVTEGDRASEALIRARLTKAFPEHGIYGEEGTRDQMESEFRWYVDPLDGTTNFAHGFPVFCWRGRPYANSNWRPTPSKRTTVGWSSGSWCAIFKEGKPMQLTYDPRHNIAYIRLREKSDEVETLRISDELNIDLAPDGGVYGIELLNANAQLYGSEGASLVVGNEQLQLRKQISLGEA